MTKREFKICEAVALGYNYYYEKAWNKRKIKPKERAMALVTIPTLPSGWMWKLWKKAV